MAKTFRISDGDTTISLILSTGLDTSGAGHGPQSLGGLNMLEVTMPISAHVRASSHDDAASQLRGLRALLKRAENFAQTQWQLSPVWIEEKTHNETNSRFALIKGVTALNIPDAFSPEFTYDNFMPEVSFVLVREHPWRASAPNALGSAVTLTKTDGTSDAAVSQIVPLTHTQQASHLFNFDDSLTAYSANLIAANDIDLFYVANPVAVNDAMFIGFATRVGFNFCVPMKTAGAYTGATFTAYYWKGGGSPTSVALTEGADIGGIAVSPLGLQSIFTTTDDWVISFRPGSDWALATINGVSAYWVSIKITALTSWDTQPVSDSTDDPYTPRKNYVTLPAAAFGGDANPRLLFRLRAPVGSGAVSQFRPSRILVAAKSRNLSNFDANLSLHQYGLPGSWARTLGTDATETADPEAWEGYRTAVSFASPALLNRLTLTGTALLDDYVGTYQLALLCEQSGGDPGDVSVKVRTYQGAAASGYPYRDSELVAMKSIKSSNVAREVVDLGLLELPFAPIVSADAPANDLIFEVHAERTAGTSTLNLFQLILLPADEFFIRADDVGDTTGAAALGGPIATDLMIDFGLLAHRAIKRVRNATSGAFAPSVFWAASVGRQLLEPNKLYRLFVLPLHYRDRNNDDDAAATFGGGVLHCYEGAHLEVSIYGAKSYETLRGTA